MDYWEFLVFDDAWDYFLHPWFKMLSQSSPSQLPNAIIVPNASVSSFLKQKLVQHELSYVDLHFYTPTLLRQKLASLLLIDAKTLLREDLHLLTRYVCSQFPTNPLAKASCHDPEPLAHLMDSVIASGIDFSSLPIPEATPLMYSFLNYILPKNILTSQLFDKQILERISNNRRFFEKTLLFGFSGQSWNHFPLLKAAFLSSTYPTLCFSMTQTDTSIERVWQGTWESLSSPVQLIPFTNRSPYVDFANSFKSISIPAQHSYKPKVPALITEKSKLAEANLIFKQIINWLNTHSTARIGIIFPEQNSALARMLSAILSDFNLPHYNTVHPPSASSKEERAFRSLVAFLNNPILNTLFHFLNSLQSLDLITSAELIQIKKDCHQAFLETGTDALPLIIYYINSAHPQNPLNSVLEIFPLLENEATLSEYFQKALPLLKKINYPPNLILLAEQSSISQFILEKHITKEWFLTWLSDVVRLMHPNVTNELATHPYANIHLLTPVEAISQSWTHLVFAELENTNWTLKNKDTPYLSYKDIRFFNTFTFTQGLFGSGHLIAKPHHIPFTPSSELSIIAESNFERLFHLATESVVCTSSNDILSAVPIISPLLEKMTFLIRSLKTREEGASEDRIEAHELARKNSNIEATQSSFIDIDLCKELNQTDSTDAQPYLSLLAKNFAQSTTEQCENAYWHRQDSTTSFNAFSFSFENNLPKDTANISCKTWELVLTKPEVAWTKIFIDIERQTDYAIEDVSRIIMGSWAHNWICLNDCKSGNFIAKPQESTWTHSASTKANAELASLKKRHTAIQQMVPSRFLSKWHSAVQTTHNWIKTISRHSDIAYIASEYVLPHNTFVCLENICKFPVTGRLDLVAKSDHSNEKLWVIDFKSGNPSPLTTNNFLQGKGLQIIFYALALASNAHAMVDFSYLQPFSPLKRQCSLEDLSELTALWHALKLIHEKGVFGQKEFTRFNHVSNVPQYPIATLTISNSVLSKKWNLTHPHLIIKS